MANYQFHCPNCNNDFEQNVLFRNIKNVTCPSCSTKAKRVFTAPTLKFVGSGFYENDYSTRNRAAEQYSDDPVVMKGALEYMEANKIKTNK